ncbi:MAG: 2-phospho-L-lactate guanylyltransferase [Halapricum sp.]
MYVVVPFDAREPKTRLSTRFDRDERCAFAREMLDDVCAAVEATGQEPTVLATDDIDCRWPVHTDDRPLTDAVNAVLAECEAPVAIVMADLALATPDALARVFDADGEVVLVPGRGGGTNVILARHPDFRVDYHGASIRDHRRAAATLGVEPTEVDSFRLSTDVDEPADLVEVLLHTDGAAADWLREHGVSLVIDNGRVGIEREW